MLVMEYKMIRLVFFGFDNLAAPIITTTGAGMVWEGGFTTLRAS
jgi:hypothetical protein